ncbi:M56 family metallopeptidase [Chitinophaga defluvii]|uniref:M56 family metallopeptidase n=1 Tax=Chitinophaga defluvii TaxID=3163343 RepID=A0ABV2SYG3_9BACT
MNPFTYYLAKMLLCSGIFYIYYYIVLRNNRFHQWNRYYILMTTLLSLLIPLLQIPLSFSAQPETPAVLTYTAHIITLREHLLPAPHPVNYTLLFTIGYCLIATLLLLRIGYSCLKIYRLIKAQPVQAIPPYLFVQNQAVTAPFSFFSYIFWGAHTNLESREGRQILRHELVHIHEKHSIDKMIMEVITAICWINPFFHLFKRELAIIHEFIADKKAAAQSDVANYAQTILQMALQSSQLAITNSFFHPPIKRRILMLTQLRQPKFSYLRRLLVLPLAAFIFCSLAFVTGNTGQAADLSGPIAVNDTVPTTKTTPVPTVPTTPVDQTDKEEVFTFVEHPPQFPGGEKALIKYLGDHIKYPKAAVDNKIEATIFVQFLVDKEGNIKRVKTVGAPKGYGLEEESMRVVNAMPKWVPGVQNKRKVAVQFNLPIRYSLQSKAPAGSEPVSFIEQPPQFPGGEAALMQYLSKNIKYPAEAEKRKAEGTVFVQMIVTETGELTAIKVLGKSPDGALADEAVRVVKAMPKWKPGKQDGKLVAVRYNLPIRFTL